ncbi:STAS domain-containing protein [Mycobacterium sp.]|uniref:STAS domain-containing protein n=1 Tax=Mycobacterium sp. TaxID=1785 RepID=UPI00127EF0F1|nr:STAS domain-containing protein [Mycobacterium sp.]KAA8964266.1 MAG: STAS domain-containing protein [Mycobacterium sp.]
MAENHAVPGKTDFDVTETWVRRLAVVSVRGDVDMLSAPRLTEAIDSALAKEPHGLIIDLSRVEFLGSAGISVLMAAHGKMGESGRFAVVADGPATHRPLTLLGLHEIISVHRTLDDALTALADA